MENIKKNLHHTKVPAFLSTEQTRISTFDRKNMEKCKRKYCKIINEWMHGIQKNENTYIHVPNDIFGNIIIKVYY